MVATQEKLMVFTFMQIGEDYPKLSLAEGKYLEIELSITAMGECYSGETPC